MLNSRLIIETPYDQAGIVTGYADKVKYQSDQYLHLDLLGGGTSIISVIKAYADSYKSSAVKTLLDCRDYFVTQALAATLTSTLYTDSTQQTLTSHAAKAVSTVTTKAVYPSVIRDKDQPLSSSFGTLAYYFLFINPEGYPTDYLTKLLNYVWGLLGLRYDASPKDRITKLYKLLGKTNGIDKAAETALKTALAATEGSPNYASLLHARRNFLTTADVTNFSLRLLTGKYAAELYPIFAAVLPEEEYKKLAVYRSNVISVLRPVGFNLLLSAFVVEGYLRAAQYISGLPNTITSMSLDDFLINENLRSTHGSSIASHLATAYDALDFIQTYNLYDAGDANTLLSFIYNWTPPSINAKDSTRLYTLFDTIDIDKNTRQVFTDSLLEELSQLPPVGNESINLEASSTASKVSLSATNFSSSSPPIIAFVTSSSTTTPKSFNAVASAPSSFTSNTIAVDVDSNRSLAAVAITGTGIRDGQTIDLSELNNIRSSNTPNVSVSNVQVIEGTVIPDVGDTVSGLISQQASKYYLFNYLTATSRPRGSSTAQYEAQGVRPEVLSTAQIESTFGYRQEGYLDEYAGRMAGLTQQQKEVHVDSELKVLKGWAGAIKQITNSIAAPPIVDELPTVDELPGGDVDFTLD